MLPPRLFSYLGLQFSAGNRLAVDRCDSVLPRLHLLTRQCLGRLLLWCLLWSRLTRRFLLRRRLPLRRLLRHRLAGRFLPGRWLRRWKLLRP